MLASGIVVTVADFQQVDMRVGRIVTAEEFPAAGALRLLSPSPKAEPGSPVA